MMKTMTERLLNALRVRRDPIGPISLAPPWRTPERRQLTGWLGNVTAGSLQSWGLLGMMSLHHAESPTGTTLETRGRFVPPLDALMLERVPNYGTVVLRARCERGVVIAPMHLAYFQDGAQNHATSRYAILEAGEDYVMKDAFCIQQSQGGLLSQGQQRFLVLPLDLRPKAFALRNQEGFGRLWSDIDQFTRKFGVAAGGHLERFLRPQFSRLLPYRQALETLPGQAGALYFVAGRLVGIEWTPNPEYWANLGPILTLYCYGSAALRARALGWTNPQASQAATPEDPAVAARDREALWNEILADRQREKDALCDQTDALLGMPWEFTDRESRLDLTVTGVSYDAWSGQVIRDANDEVIALSLFRALPQTPAPNGPA